ncbi:MAG TPA: transporter [Polyangiaceae bacterium]|nr:transporter [Polyangiaceae bacterium]
MRWSPLRALLFGALLVSPSTALAQACCAGVSAITPARLELHERALLGAELRAAHALGNFNSSGDFHSNPKGASELDFEQDVFGSVRWLGRGQASLLVPFLISRRSSATTGSELGAGLGDLNLGARYDLVRNRELSYLPGIGLLAGATLPTGRPPEDAKKPLASDSTGTGAVQVSLGLALERSFGSVLVTASGLGAKRFSRSVRGVQSALAPQLTGILGVGYAFSDATAAALVGTYTYEGDASIDERDSPGTARKQLRVALAGSHTLDDAWRLRASVFVDPPVSGLGQNQPAAFGAAIGAIWSLL